MGGDPADPGPTPTAIVREPVSTSPGQSGTAPTETNGSTNTAPQSPISSATYYSFAYSSLLLIFGFHVFVGMM